jgi:hypothetical protein
MILHAGWTASHVESIFQILLEATVMLIWNSNGEIKGVGIPDGGGLGISNADLLMCFLRLSSCFRLVLVQMMLMRSCWNP